MTPKTKWNLKNINGHDNKITAGAHLDEDRMAWRGILQVFIFQYS